MGYVSDGRWIITGHKDDITAAWAELRLNPPEYHPDPNIISTPPTLDDLSCYTVGDKGYIRFSFSGWKWYSSYPHVQWYESIWNRLADNDLLSGKRIHIGEDNEVNRSDFGDKYIELYAVCSFDDKELQPPTN